MSSDQQQSSAGPPTASISESPAQVKVVFQPNGRQGNVAPGTTLLDAARGLGVEIESICGGNQTCGKCKVQVEEGEFSKFAVTSTAASLTPPGQREQEYARDRNFAPGMRLSCACHVLDDVVIRVPEESQTRKQVVRKAAGVTRQINVDAPMRLYYVELPPATMEDRQGDWQRLQRKLEEVHGLTDLIIDWRALQELQPVLAKAGRTVTVTLFNDREVVRVQPGFHDRVVGMAVDVGTTTVAGHLCDLRTGEIIASASRMNPQVPFGEDLMSRVSYAMMNDAGTQRMHDAIIDGLNELAAEACADADLSPDEIVEMVLVGNTTMHHILLNVNPVELGGAPFSLVTHDSVDVKARELGLHLAAGANVHFPPCEAGHVGADNVGVLVAEAPYARDEQSLVIDIGTNGEILLGNRERVLSASSPTGPAFEGAEIRHGMRAAPGAMERVRIDPATLAVRYRIIGREEWIDSPSTDAPTNGMVNLDALPAPERRKAKRDALLNPELKAAGICGSGIIEAIAELYLAGVIAPSGRFVSINHPRLRTGLGEGGGKAEFVLAWPHETGTGSAVVVHSDDIRAIQLGKAALYAGTKLLMQHMGLDTVDRIVLAGGFGSYIDPKHAMILGLIPACDLDHVQAVGNAAGDGARMILLDKAKRAEADWAARWVNYIETAIEPSFQDEFVAAINIPNAIDPFPQVDALLAAAQAEWETERSAANAAARNGSRPAGRRRRGRKEPAQETQSS